MVRAVEGLVGEGTFAEVHRGFLKLHEEVREFLIPLLEAKTTTGWPELRNLLRNRLEVASQNARRLHQAQAREREQAERADRLEAVLDRIAKDVNIDLDEFAVADLDDDILVRACQPLAASHHVPARPKT